MRAFPRDEAAAIYRRLYWLRPRFDAVAARAPALAAELFDTGVNMGPGVATGFLQRALNALNRGARDYPDLVRDRSEEHTSELQSLMRISYAGFCLKKKKRDYSTYTT